MKRIQENLHLVEISEEESEAFLDSVSSNVERIREEKGISKLDASRALGFMYPDHYSRMELRANKKHFNLLHLYKLSRFFEVDISEFIKLVK
jgi:hypothetical protein